MVPESAETPKSLLELAKVCLIVKVCDTPRPAKDVETSGSVKVRVVAVVSPDSSNCAFFVASVLSCSTNPLSIAVRLCTTLPGPCASTSHFDLARLAEAAAFRNNSTPPCATDRSTNEFPPIIAGSTEALMIASPVSTSPAESARSSIRKILPLITQAPWVEITST